MSGAPKVHIFLGAPILPISLKTSREREFSTAPEDKWRNLHLLFNKDPCNLCTRRCKNPAPNNAVVAVNAKDDLPANFTKKCGLMEGSLTNHVSDTGNTKYINTKTETCLVDGQTSSDSGMKHLTYEQTSIHVNAGKLETKPSEEAEGGVRHMRDNNFDMSALASSTKNNSRGVTFTERDETLPNFQCDPHQLLSQYIEICPQLKKQSKTAKPLEVCSGLAVSTDVEFLSVLTASQVAVLAGRPVAGPSEGRSNSAKVKGSELKGSCRKSEDVIEPLETINERDGVCAEVAVINCRQEYENSLELFSFDSHNCSTGEAGFQEKDGVLTGLLRSPGNKPDQELSVKQSDRGILCFQGDNAPKRSWVSEESLSELNCAVVGQQRPKKAKLISSPLRPVPQMEQLRISVYKKVHKQLSLLKDCFCTGQKYSVLVTVLHPCHIREIQMKSRTKRPSKIPLAMIVVFDQSETQRTVTLWRAAAFWSLTIFPGDVVLLTDVSVYENRWTGEMMLQSTFTSHLLNLGSCSTIRQNEFSHTLDVNILQDLLAYVSSKHAYLQALPQRQPQKLNKIQNVLLNQLKADTLVHSVVRIVTITVLTESTYSFQGERQRKIILTVEQVQSQHYALVLWGAAAASYPQFQRKQDHIWVFKHLYAKHNPVSGELELHTTPWSSFECLFHDDKRAVEFREKFETNKSVKETLLAAHLEEKCSGMIRVKARVLALKFMVGSALHGQLIFDANTSLQHVFASLSLITYTGCEKCGLELPTDDNKIYKQCLSCLPCNKVKICYRPALMTIEDGGYEISVRVVSELVEKIFLNIPADWLNKALVPSLDTTYGMLVADLCHSLVTDTKASFLLEIRSHFVLDENSYPLEKDFHLLAFHLDL